MQTFTGHQVIEVGWPDFQVARNGETLINETWRSNYKPWQAIFLVGTQ